MTTWKIKAAPTIRNEITVPGDKSISHRAAIIAGLSNGTCVIRGFLPSDDCLCTVNAIRALGVDIEQPDPTTLIVHGTRKQLREPRGPIDCGNSGTSMRLLAGVLAAQPFTTELFGDASLSRRPMNRIIEPLTLMGAKITAKGEGGRPPLVIEGGRLQPIAYTSPVASAQVKSAILLAGLFAKGKTSVTEPEQTRNHTETMLAWHLVRPYKDGRTVSILGEATPESRDFTVPGDISSAAFWMVAAAAQPGSRLLIRNVGLNRTRTAVLDVLVRMGAHVREIIEEVDEGEPSGSVEIKGAPLRGTTLAGKEIPNLIDELPVLAVAGALADGTTVIADAAELRVKESDRIASVAKGLRAFGVEVDERPDGMEIRGGRPLEATRIESGGDHRIAMAFAIAGLFAEGTTEIVDTDCVDTSYPGFHATLESLTKPADHTPVIEGLPIGAR